jgi:hypothetical protein
MLLLAIADVRAILKSFDGNAEKTLEWFLGGGVDALPASDPDDDIPPLIDVDPPLAATPNPIASASRATESRHGEPSSSSRGVIADRTDTDDQQDSRNLTHPNRVNFVMRDDTDIRLEEEKRDQLKNQSYNGTDDVYMLFAGKNRLSICWLISPHVLYAARRSLHWRSSVSSVCLPQTPL